MTVPAAPDLTAAIRTVPDHPSPGVTFRDITPLLADPQLFRAAIDGLVTGLSGPAGEPGPGGGAVVDVVTGIEARGFILAAPVALRLGVGFVPVRKQGKLPWNVATASYSLEYAEATVEIHEDGVRPGQRVLIVDDVLATGGTARAARELVEGLGGRVVAARFLVEIEELAGRSALPGVAVESLIRF